MLVFYLERRRGQLDIAYLEAKTRKERDAFYELCYEVFVHEQGEQMVGRRSFFKDRKYFLAVNEAGTAIGTIAASPGGQIAGYVHITSVAVSHEFRGQRVVGPGLLRFIEEWALKSGYVGCTLRAYGERENFYVRNGYRVISPGINLPHETRHLMFFKKQFFDYC